MNKTLSILAAGAFLASASSALAADVIYDEPAPFVPAPVVYDWTGFYVGVNGGYVWTKASLGGDSENFNGGVLGVHAGYNFQNGPWVLGIEGDVAYTWNENSYFGGLVEAGTDWQGSVRGRVGYAIDRTLIYGTAGLAVTNAYIDVPSAPFSLDDTLVGWTVGAGIEHAFTDNWSARLEYRYSDFGEFKPDGIATGVDVTEHTLRVGISYKF